jgi:hypothetical protein
VSFPPSCGTKIVHVCAGLCRFVFVPVCAGLCRFVPVCASLCQFVPVCATLCRFVPFCATVLFLFRSSNSHSSPNCYPVYCNIVHKHKECHSGEWPSPSSLRRGRRRRRWAPPPMVSSCLCPRENGCQRGRRHEDNDRRGWEGE